jgi:uncharacterized protein YqgC (DUF456 family)
MDYLIAAVLSFFNLIWLAFTVFMLPGNWLIVITAAAVFWLADGMLSVYTVIAAAVLAGIGELVEFFAGAGGAKRSGAGLAGTILALAGALIGAIAGTVIIPIPVIGTLLGAATGAGLGALFAEYTSGKAFGQSITIAFGAGTGQLLGTVAKLIIGCVIWLITTIALFAD